MGTLIDEIADMATTLLSLGAKKPPTALVGRDFAEALWHDMPSEIGKPSLHDWLESVERGTAKLHGVRLEAGWLNG